MVRFIIELIVLALYTCVFYLLIDMGFEEVIHEKKLTISIMGAILLEVLNSINSNLEKLNDKKDN